MSNVVVVDYGMGNIKSVQRGLERARATVTLSSIPEEIAKAERLVLPGVGAFKDGMEGLSEAGVIPAIDEFVKKGNPLMGICLGMQMLLERSEEHGSHSGLGFIPGIVSAVPEKEDGKHVRKIPHIGWNTLHCPISQSDWHGSILSDIAEDDYFYFVHSFMAVPENSENLLAYAEYENLRVTAAVRKDNVMGFQFHPEKSGDSGLKILESFINI